jgi:dTDP-glucose 4,6-dehydratase
MTKYTYFITGGCGFIGSNFIHFILENEPDSIVVNLDKLTYAGNPSNLKDIDKDRRYQFYRGDICDQVLVEKILQVHHPDYLVNFAAESHVDRSIGNPDDFIKTDVLGTYHLLEAVKKFPVKRFVQISTDEVYGSIVNGSSKESDSLMPRNPYSASKAAADRLAYSYYATYDQPVIITRASNNYGPFQYPEKLIPLFVTNAFDDQKLPVYGDGKNIRDWIYVNDHCDAIRFLLIHGDTGEVYNIGAGNEKTNIEITAMILQVLGKPVSLIKFVKDRPGHDRRYSLNTEKIRKIGWEPTAKFRSALQSTIKWYTNNLDWWRPIKSGKYLDWYRSQYKELEKE